MNEASIPVQNPFASRTILASTEDPLERRRLQEGINREGAQITFVPYTLLASKAISDRPDLIILDVFCLPPAIDPRTILTPIFEEAQTDETPLICLTAPYRHPGEWIEALRGYHIRFFRKIYRWEDLASLIRDMWQNEAEAQQLKEEGERFLCGQVEHAKGYLLLGKARSKVSNDMQALAYYQSALLLDPDCTEAYYLAGRILINLNRDEEAIMSLEAAIQRSPSCAAAYLSLGYLYDRRNQQSKAIEVFKKAAEYGNEKERSTALLRIKLLSVA